MSTIYGAMMRMMRIIRVTLNLRGPEHISGHCGLNSNVVNEKIITFCNEIIEERLIGD